MKPPVLGIWRDPTEDSIRDRLRDAPPEELPAPQTSRTAGMSERVREALAECRTVAEAEAVFRRYHDERDALTVSKAPRQPRTKRDDEEDCCGA